MFRQINPFELIVGEKYKMKYHSNDPYYYTGIFKTHVRGKNTIYQLFDSVLMYPNPTTTR